MILERLGVLTDEVSQNLPEALDWARDQCLKHVELRMVEGKNVVDLSNNQLDSILEEVEKRGLFISGIASPLFKCALDPSRPVSTGDRFGQREESVHEHFHKLDRLIEIAKRLKTDKIRIFSFWREQDPNLYENEVVNHLKHAAKVAESANKILLLENEASCNGGYAAEVANIVKQIDSPYLRALWDPGNEAYGGRPAFPEGYETIKDFIGHVHLKDAWVDHNGEPHCVPIGSGHVSYVDQFHALQRDKYMGLFTIETHYIPEGGTAMEGTKMTIDGLKKLLKVLRI